MLHVREGSRRLAQHCGWMWALEHGRAAGARVSACGGVSVLICLLVAGGWRVRVCRGRCAPSVALYPDGRGVGPMVLHGCTLQHVYHDSGHGGVDAWLIKGAAPYTRAWPWSCLGLSCRQLPYAGLSCMLKQRWCTANGNVILCGCVLCVQTRCHAVVQTARTVPARGETPYPVALLAYRTVGTVGVLHDG